MLKVLAKIYSLKKEMDSVKKSSNNPFFKSKYADLNAHLELLEPLLEKNKLVLLQPVIGQSVSSRIYDIESGESVESNLQLTETNDMQKLGGAVTYARRYTLNALLGMMTEDDDGNAATGKTSTPVGSTGTATKSFAPKAGGFKAAAGKKVF